MQKPRRMKVSSSRQKRKKQKRIDRLRRVLGSSNPSRLRGGNYVREGSEKERCCEHALTRVDTDACRVNP